MTILRPAWRALAGALILACAGCGSAAPGVISGETGSTEAAATEATSGDRSDMPSSTESPATASESRSGVIDMTPRAGTAVTVTAVDDQPEVAAGTVVASGLDVPWGIDFFPDGDALVSERDTAELKRVSPDGSVTDLAIVTGVTPTAEGGLLGVAVSPDYATDGLVYVYSTTAEDNRVRRGSLEDFRTGNDTAVVTGIPRGSIHDGGRLAFGPDGMLYISTGETGDAELSQDLDSLGGKILRVRPDGAVPEDNPIPGSPIWSWGHRNVQGLAWDDQGRMWASEFGASTWDEINQILPGQNYGWPAVEGSGGSDEYTDPAAVFATSSASPSGLAYADGRLWMGALQGATLWRLTITDNGALTDVQAVRVAPARTRSVALAPDGRLWVTTSNTDGRGQPTDDQDTIIAIQP